MADFDLLKVKVKNRFIFCHGKGTSSHQTASFEILRIKIGCASKSVQPFKGFTRVKEGKKLKNKNKKHKPLYVG